ncbi:ATP-dependent DNA helicase Q-like 3 protein [Tanacetum coccineum]
MNTHLLMSIFTYLAIPNSPTNVWIWTVQQAANLSIVAPTVAISLSRYLTQFILNNAANKKSPSPSSQDASPKKSIDDFNLMVDCCETSGCHRKKILDGFGEQVPTSLCKKTCDICKDPKLGEKYLKELKTMGSLRNRGGSSQIFISSSPKPVDADLSEFWSRDDEAAASEDDISDDDDGNDVVEGLTQSALPSKSRISDEMELIDPETSSVFFENECYKKYGKTGKSFYLSQVASTVRWLSTANAEDLTSRLATCLSPTLKIETEVEPSSTESPAVSDQVRKMTSEKDHVNVSSGDINSPSQSTYNDIKLPPIPFFSEFINKKSSKDSKRSTLKRESSYGVNRNQFTT